MNIDISKIDSADFLVKESTIADEDCFLIVPQAIGTKWAEDNLHLRSVILNQKGDVISASFPKFFNWEEKPDITGKPRSIEECKVLEKLDGSTLILSKYKGQIILRTRGTFDATNLQNGSEIDVILKKYPKLTSHNKENTWEYSLLFEWLSPTNRIVIKHDEVDIKLIGGIQHSNYGLWSQQYLDHIASNLDVSRPKYWSFENITEMRKVIEKIEGEEGVCVYYNDDSNIRKIKGDEYLHKHRLKSELGSRKNIFNYWAYSGYLNPEEFCAKVEVDIDYETAKEVKPTAIELEECKKWFNEELTKIINILEFEGPWETRKSFAELVSRRVEPLMRRFAFKFGDHEFTIKNGKVSGNLEQFEEMKIKVLKAKLGI